MGDKNPKKMKKMKQVKKVAQNPAVMQELLPEPLLVKKIKKPK